MIFEQFNQRAFGSKANATWLDVTQENVKLRGTNTSVSKAARLASGERCHIRPTGVGDAAKMNLRGYVIKSVALISIGQPTVIFDPNGTQYETDIILSECDFCLLLRRSRCIRS